MFALLHCFVVAERRNLFSTMRFVISRSPTTALSAIRSSVMKLHSAGLQASLLSTPSRSAPPHFPPARVRLLTRLPPQVNAGTLVRDARVGRVLTAALQSMPHVSPDRFKAHCTKQIHNP